MVQGILESRDFDRYMSIAEKEHRHASITANDAFAAAMNKQIGRGREKASPGTFVDTSPTFARRIIGELAISACGSPSAMCLESGGEHAGAETMK